MAGRAPLDLPGGPPAVAGVAPAPRAAGPLGRLADADEADQALAARLLRLQEMSAALAEALTVDDVARAVLRAVAGLPAVVRGGLALGAAGGRELRFLALQDHDGHAAGPPAWCVLDAGDDLPLAVSSRTGEALWFPTLADLDRRFPALAEHEAGFGARALAAVPLRARDARVGALMVCYAEPRSFGPTERAFLAALAEQAAHALRRAVAFERQQGTAETLQRALLPDLLPEVPGLAMAARYVPGAADVGGDWFDVLPLPDGTVLAVIGDVMGRGVGAATVMGELRASLRAYALLDPDPVVVLERLDRLVATFGSPEQIVTVLAVAISTDRSCARLASAGHLPPALAVPGEPAMLVAVPADPPLGLAAGDRRGAALALPPGAALVLATDGLVESASQPVDEGLARLRDVVDATRARSRLPQDLCAALAADLGDPSNDDDRAVLVVASTVGRDRRADRVTLPGDLRSPARGRRWLRALLRGWAVPAPVVDDAVACLSEVVTNAVIHAGTGAQLAVELADHRLLVSVVDAGRRGSAQHRPAPVEDIRGRGLGVVAALATAWGSERRSDGTLVWFELHLPATAGAAGAAV